MFRKTLESPQRTFCVSRMGCSKPAGGKRSPLCASMWNGLVGKETCLLCARPGRAPCGLTSIGSQTPVREPVTAPTLYRVETEARRRWGSQSGLGAPLESKLCYRPGLHRWLPVHAQWCLQGEFPGISQSEELVCRIPGGGRSLDSRHRAEL